MTKVPARPAIQTLDPRRFVPGTPVLACLATLIVLGSLVVSDGLYNLDEFVIAASVDALRSNGSLTFDNGYGQFGSDSLKLWLFAKGPHGLASQYPIGSTALGALLTGPMGIRGLIVMNALAAAASLFVTRRLARLLFDDDKIAFNAALLLGTCTFWLEFAYGVWPHAMSALLVACALLWALKSIDANGRDATRWALFSGLAVSVALLLRMDSLLILPPIGLCVYLLGRHPWRALVAGAAGLVPGIATMSVVNHHKFGSYNPFSYGQPGGATDLGGHTAAIASVVLVGLALLLIKRAPLQRITRTHFVAVFAIAAALVLAVPSLRGYAWDYSHGFWALVVDSGVIRDPRPGMGANADGVLFFWGFVKKAVGQSLPWIGVLFVLALKPRTERLNRFLIIASITFGLWTLPFMVKAWHGGLGSNMRYFLPLLPFVCATAAAAWVKLLAIAGGNSRISLLGAVAGLLMVALWTWFGPSRLAGAQQIMSTYLLLATSLACMLVWLVESQRKQSAQLAQFMVAAGFSVSAAFGLLDLSASQAQRNLMAQTSDTLSTIESPSLIFGPPEMLTFQIGRPEGLIALSPGNTENSIDFDLIDKAIEAGYTVYATRGFAALVTESNRRFELGPNSRDYPGGRIIEISPRTKAKDGSAFPVASMMTSQTRDLSP